MSDDTDDGLNHDEENSLNLSTWGKLKEFFNRYIQIKWVLPPFIVLGVVSSLAFQGVVNLNSRNTHQAAVKTYEQCLLSHNAGLANKELQQSIVDSTRLSAGLVESIVVIAVGPLQGTTNPKAQQAALKIAELRGQINLSQAKVNAIKIRDCTALQPAGYDPDE